MAGIQKFDEKQQTVCGCLRMTSRTNFLSAYNDELKTHKIGCSLKSFLTSLKALSCWSVHRNVCLFFNKSINDLVIREKSLTNLLKKLANPMKLLTALISIGIGKLVIPLVLFSRCNSTFWDFKPRIINFLHEKQR